MKMDTDKCHLLVSTNKHEEMRNVGQNGSWNNLEGQHYWPYGIKVHFDQKFQKVFEK